MTSTVAASAPAWTETHTTATFQQVFHAFDIRLTTYTCTNPDALPEQVRDSLTTYYQVTLACFEHTAHGQRPDSIRTRPFTTADDARAYANSWARSLLNKGWTRRA